MDQHQPELAGHAANHTQQGRQGPHTGRGGRAEHAARGVEEGLQRDGHDRQHEGQEEAEAHLRRSGDDPEGRVGGRRHRFAAHEGVGRLLVLNQDFAHQRQARLDRGEHGQQEQEAPGHLDPRRILQSPDHREQVGDAQRFHQEHAGEDFQQDDDQRADFGDLQAADDGVAAHHFGHRPGDQAEVDAGAERRHRQHQGGDHEVGEGRGRQCALRLVGLLQDSLILRHMLVDHLRLLQECGDVLVAQPQRGLQLAHIRHHGFQELVPHLRRLAVLVGGGRVGLDQRCMDDLEDLGHHRIALGIDIGNRLHRFHPARGRGRHVGAVRMVFLDRGDALADAPVQRRRVGKIAADGALDTLEFALDNMFLLLAPMRQQHLAVTQREILLRAADRVGRNSQAPVKCPGQGQDGLVRRLPGDVKQRRQDSEPDDAR